VSSERARQPAARSRSARGIVPVDIDRRLHEQELDLKTRHLAKVLARELEGRPPLLAAGRIRGEICEAWDAETIQQALVALDRTGYGKPFPKKPRRLRGHGARLEERPRLKGLVGKLPRALALRLPTTSNNLLSGRRDGRDVWGEVRCNMTLRDGALGVLAIAGGMWVRHGHAGQRHVDMTAGEAAYLLRAKRRASKRTCGRDIAWVYEQLAALAALELEASGGGDGHEIPSSPVAQVLRKQSGEWVTLGEYAAAVEAGFETAGAGAQDTIRIVFADWFIAELRHEKRRPVLIDFCVWRQLRPLARRLYAMLQATSRAAHDHDRLYVWFAPVARTDGRAVGGSRAFTLGFTTPRLDKVAAKVRAAIAELREVDERYDGYGRQTTHGTTDFPAFTVRVKAGQASRARHPERVGRAFDWSTELDPREVARAIRRSLEQTELPLAAPPGG
jgi:hypothetical protein